MKKQFILFLFLLLVVPTTVLAQQTNQQLPQSGNNIQESGYQTYILHLSTTRQGQREHRYTLNVTQLSTTPDLYSFKIIAYDYRYQYGGNIRWRNYPNFPYGEGIIRAQPNSTLLNITGWLGQDVPAHRFQGLMTRLDSFSQQKHWMIAKESNSAHIGYGPYVINATYP